jgi:hypothetical protein
VTKYCYDGDQIIAEYDGSNTLTKKFVYGPGIDEPIPLMAVVAYPHQLHQIVQK